MRGRHPQAVGPSLQVAAAERGQRMPVPASRDSRERRARALASRRGPAGGTAGAALAGRPLHGLPATPP
eukprot:scaffold6184_cov129-Isochrysis_galbana.AAC.2